MPTRMGTGHKEVSAPSDAPAPYFCRLLKRGMYTEKCESTGVKLCELLQTHTCIKGTWPETERHGPQAPPVTTQPEAAAPDF